MQFDNLPIRKKVTRVILLISITILTITCAVFFVNDYYAFRQNSVEKLEIVGKIIATNSTAALAFNSKEDAVDVISAVGAEPNIVAVCMYDSEGQLFAYYPENIETKLKLDGAVTAKHSFSGGYLTMYLPVQESGKNLGTVFLKYDMSGLITRAMLYLLIILIIMVVSMALVWFFSRKLQGNVILPILNLAKTANKIAVEADYSVRAEKEYNDEVGSLTDSFNKMVSEIEEQSGRLSKYNLDLKEKATQLEQASKYKSEFLANMSHELRSPLNSLLILSKDLAENREGNLNEEEVESVNIIHDSGTDLLNLINDILDLSKIEAGKMEAHFEWVSVKKVLDVCRNTYTPLAEQKGIDFQISAEEGVPERIYSDAQRLGQILKNLLSNAIKFTSNGSVQLKVGIDEGRIFFKVKDSGIGIPEDKQALIFEAFKQAEGGTSRRYGGTGLGLSIASQLVELLGGKIRLNSEAGKGSTFSIWLPLEQSEMRDVSPIRDEASNHSIPLVSTEEAEAIVAKPDDFERNVVQDDRKDVSENERHVLIIEDDVPFAKILQQEAQVFGFKTLVATSAEEGLELCDSIVPSAIILDLKLPGMSGLTFLGIMKSKPEFRHIPVHIISSLKKEDTPIKAGVLNYLSKPVSRDQVKFAFKLIQDFLSTEIRKLLVVEDEKNIRVALTRLLADDNLEILETTKVSGAVDILQENHIDCVILDLKLEDGSGTQLIDRTSEWKDYIMPPVIVYTGMELSKSELGEIKKWAETVVLKGKGNEDRLVRETDQYLYKKLKSKKNEPTEIASTENGADTTSFAGKRVLIVDDDMRNIFALSKALSTYKMEILRASSGAHCLSLLESEDKIDLILMDIMMPEMDGYETIGRVRNIPDYEHVPIVALTAKAMKEDRQKCIDAGASDYFSKPVDVSKLVKLLAVWLK